jgi:hypothetical protein
VNQRQLNNRQAIKSAWTAFHALFRNAIAVDQPLLTPGSGIILWDVRSELTEEQFVPIAAAVAQEGDDEAYLSFLGDYQGNASTMTDDFEIGAHYRISLDRNPAEALGEDWPAFSEYALYSPRGIWGIVTSLEWHAIAVGTEAFRSRLSAASPFVDSLEQFLEYWRDSRDRLHGRTAWLPDLLGNVYGADNASKILAKFGDSAAWTRNG